MINKNNVWSEGIQLKCPDCRRENGILSFDKKRRRIVCKVCGSDYKMEKGIPQLVHRLDTNRHQVMKSFADKWSRVSNYGYKKETAAFTKKWFFERYNWYKSEKDFRHFLNDKKNILDAGCGLGYLLRWIRILTGRDDSHNIVGFDISDSVFEAAKKNQNGICFIQADIMNPPFKKNFFDYIVSDGVLHHTPSTKKALGSLLRLLKPSGVIEFYIYRKKNPIREFCDDYIRKYTTCMTENECWNFCKSLTELARQTSALKSRVQIRRTIPILEIEKGVYTFHELLYYFFIKMFWNKNFSFAENNLVNFDWYHPRYAHRHTREEVYSWAKEFNAKIEKINIIKSGLAVRMRKK